MRSFRRSRAVTMLLVGVTALGVLVALPGAAQARDKRELTVMTRNLYLGASLTDAITAQNAQQFVAATTRIWHTAQFTDFPTRAGALADEIAATGPDLIGLQEVSRWLTVDFATGQPTGQIDFLALLQGQLQARGLAYDVAAVSDNANLGPFPLVCDVTTFALCSYGVVLQDRDVILVRHDDAIGWANPQDGSFQTQQYFRPPVPGAPLISFDRGWASIDVTFEGKRFRFVNTHLETEDFPAVQEAQAAEFLAGPARPSGAVIATGDFNSAADGSTTASYAMLTRPNAFSDAWAVAGDGPGLSCCQNETLTSYPSTLRSRIDLVLFRGPVRGLAAQLVGDQPFRALTAPQPIYASDHAGVVATLRVH